MKKKELRTTTCEVRADQEHRRIIGHAAVFEQATDIAGLFNEKVSRDAFNDAIADQNIMALFNHDPNKVLGRTGNGTLKLSIDETGLRYEIDLPDTATGNEVLELVNRGDISKSSFGFRTIEDSYDKETNTRTLLKVELFDVSPVTYPAYDGTDVAVRSIENTKAADRAAKAKRLWSLYTEGKERK